MLSVTVMEKKRFHLKKKKKNPSFSRLPPVSVVVMSDFLLIHHMTSHDFMLLPVLSVTFDCLFTYSLSHMTSAPKLSAQNINESVVKHSLNRHKEYKWLKRF